MRLVVGLLACLGAGGLSVAIADPPSTEPAQPAASAAAASPSASQAPKAAPAPSATPADTEDALEKHFRAEGYSVRMHNGEKLFCRREEVLGSRLEGKVSCAHKDELKAREEQAQEAAERTQRASRTGARPGGN